MTQDQFHSWLNNPKSMDSESILQLRQVVDRYPYFTAAQVMLAKNLRNENHIDQLKQLQLAAVMAPDRKVLHDYLHDKRTLEALRPNLPADTIAVEESSAEVEEDTVAAADKETTDLAEKQQEVAEETTQEQAIETDEKNTVEPRFPDELIPEPVIYQLETADLPELPPKEPEQTEPDELSFSEWLTFTETGKLDDGKMVRQLPDQAPTEKRSTIELIDHFLTKADEVPKKKAEFFNPRKVAARADKGDFTVVSETLANIYFQQEKYELAKQAYESLSLKYPEKSVYFAARLKEIEEKRISH